MQRAQSCAKIEERRGLRFCRSLFLVVKGVYMGFQYEFFRLETEAGGYSLMGGVGIVLTGHQEIIRARAAEGWRYCGWIPVKQRSEGYITQVDLVFEKTEAEA